LRYRGSKIFNGKYVFGNITTPSRGKTGIMCGRFFIIYQFCNELINFVLK